MNTDQWKIVLSLLDNPNSLRAVSKQLKGVTRKRQERLVNNYVCGRMETCEGPTREGPPLVVRNIAKCPYTTHFRGLYSFYTQVNESQWLVCPKMGQLLLFKENTKGTFVHPPALGFQRLLGARQTELIGLGVQGLILWDLKQPTKPPSRRKMELIDAALLRGGRLLLVKFNGIEIEDGEQTLTLRNVRQEHYKIWSGGVVGWECIAIGEHLLLLINNGDELNCYDARQDRHLWTKQLGTSSPKIQTWYVKGEVRIGIGDQWYSFLPPSRKRKREEMESSAPKGLENLK